MLFLKKALNKLIVNSVYKVSRNQFSSTSPGIKKFYRHVTVAKTPPNDLGEAHYEIQLDQRKLRTPAGNWLFVPNESLAYAVAAEWDMQKDLLNRQSMHLTSLCNTAVDNPTHRTKEMVVNGIMEYVETDTLCYRCSEPEELCQAQAAAWDPVLLHVSKILNLSQPISVTMDLSPAKPLLSEKDRETVYRHFMSNDQWALVGLQQIAETLKSGFLTLALVDGFLSVEKAVSLSRLESTFQVERWGTIPWYHDVELTEIQTRVAAALFFTLSSQLRRDVKRKLDREGLTNLLQ